MLILLTLLPIFLVSSDISFTIHSNKKYYYPLPLATQPPPTTQLPTTTRPPTTTQITIPAEPTTKKTPMQAKRAPTPAPTPAPTRPPTPPRPTCGDNPKDVIFVVDSTMDFRDTARAANQHFTKVKKFLKKTVSKISNKFTIAVIQYSGDGMTNVEVDFSDGTSTRKLRSLIRGIKHQRERQRYTAAALVKANSKVGSVFAQMQSSIEHAAGPGYSPE